MSNSGDTVTGRRRRKLNLLVELEWRRIPREWQRLTTVTESWQWTMSTHQVYFCQRFPWEKMATGIATSSFQASSVPIGLRHSSYFFSSKGRYDLIWEKYKSWVNLRPTYVVTWMTKGAFSRKKWQKRRGNTTICVKLLDPYYTMCRKSHLRESFELYSLSFFLLRHVDFDRLTQSSILYWWNRWLIVIGTIRSKSCAAAVNVAHALK